MISTIFWENTGDIIVLAFALATGVFAVMSAIGYTTKRDLSGLDMCFILVANIRGRPRTHIRGLSCGFARAPSGRNAAPPWGCYLTAMGLPGEPVPPLKGTRTKM